MEKFRPNNFEHLERDLNICRLGFYARHSSELQSAESSNDQFTRGRYLVEKGALIFVKYPSSHFQFRFLEEWMIKDEAISGRIAGREGLDKIVEGIKKRAFDVLLVDDLSRLTRELGSQIHLYNLLRYHNVELFSICDGISSEAPNSKTFFQIKGIVNELGNDMTALRTKRGMEARLLLGFSAGDIRYGFGSRSTKIRSLHGRDVPSHYEIFVIPEEAATVNLIYDLKLKGMGMAAIAKTLNDRNIPPSRRGQLLSKQKRPLWSPTTIRNILVCEKYIGIWHWGKSTQILNPETGKRQQRESAKDQWIELGGGNEIRQELVIVPVEKWKAVQNKMRVTREKRKTATSLNELKEVGSKSGAILTGILYCGECGALLQQVTGTKGGFYGCFTHHRKDPKACTNGRLLKRSKVEPKLLLTVRQQLLNPEQVEFATKRLNEIIRLRMSKAPQEVQELEKKQSKLFGQQKNLLNHIMNNGDSSATIHQQLTTIESELVQVNSTLKQLKSASVDKLLLTPFALRAHYEKLLEYFEKDSLKGNLALRHMFRNGVKCTPLPRTKNEKGNYIDNLWKLEGALTVGGQAGFSNYKNGVPWGIRTPVTSVKDMDRRAISS